MKRVHNAAMVAHLWANQSQEEARNSNQSFYFTGRTIYSYGSHFPIASIVELQQGLGPDVVLFTTRTYSRATATHIGYVRYAISRHQEVLHVPNVRASTLKEHAHNLKSIKEEFERVSVKAAGARTCFSAYWDRMHELQKEYSRYRNLFQPEAEPLVISEDWKDRAKVEIEAEREARKKQREREAEDARLRQVHLNENVACWVKGLPLPHNVGVYGAPIALRLKPGTRSTIETSQGGEVPMKDCRKLWELVKVIKAELRAPVTMYKVDDAYKVGAFYVRNIDQDGTLRAGCHTIMYEAMEGLAVRLGWSIEPDLVMVLHYQEEQAKREAMEEGV